MATSIGTIRYNRSGAVATFHVNGRGVMQHGLPLRHKAETLIEEGVTHLRVDLRDCTYMDSTFLGTLLTIRKRLDARGGGEMTLLAPSTACARIIKEMGLADHIPASQQPHDEAADWHELTLDSGDAGQFRRNIAQAHEELAALPGPVGEQFQAVVRCLSRTQPPDK